jgi:hypothetical protein
VLSDALQEKAIELSVGERTVPVVQTAFWAGRESAAFEGAAGGFVITGAGVFPDFPQPNNNNAPKNAGINFFIS